MIYLWDNLPDRDINCGSVDTSTCTYGIDDLLLLVHSVKVLMFLSRCYVYYTFKWTSKDGNALCLAHGVLTY